MTNPKEIFGVAVRVFGLFGLYYGLSYLNSVVYYVLYPRPHAAFPTWWLCPGLMYIAFGVYLVRGATALVRFAYPSPPLPIVMPIAETAPRNPWDARPETGGASASPNETLQGD